MEQMVLCWKCGRGEIKRTGNVASSVFCHEVGKEVKDFRNPPDGCPIKAMWAQEKAAKAVGRKPVKEGHVATHVKKKEKKKEEVKAPAAPVTAPPVEGKIACPKCGRHLTVTPKTVSLFCNHNGCGTWFEPEKKGGKKS